MGSDEDSVEIPGPDDENLPDDPGGMEAVINEILKDAISARETRSEQGSLAIERRFPGHREVIHKELGTESGIAGATESSDGGSHTGTHPPKMVGRYRILREIGMGGMGVVYLGLIPGLKRKVVIKTLRGGFQLDPLARTRLRREAEIMGRLDHEGICPSFDLIEQDGRDYMVMKYIEGQPLSALIRQARRLVDPDGGNGCISRRAATCEAGMDAGSSSRPEQARPGLPVSRTPSSRQDVGFAIHLIEKAARSLHLAHEEGVIHRDIKPDNIMITPTGQPVIMDFGLARDTTTSVPALTQSGDFLGTPHYMSPEQIGGRQEQLDRRADVYALGVTLFECLTLRRPFESPSRDSLLQCILNDIAPDARRFNPVLSRDLCVVVATALEKDVGRRYQTAGDLAEDLRRIRRFEPIRARRAGYLRRIHQWARRHPARAMALSIAMLVLCCLPWLLAPGFVVVGSEPTGAAVLLDGEDTGERTPARIMVFPRRLVVVTLRKEGFEDRNRTVYPGRFSESQVSATLEARTGTLRLDTAQGQMLVRITPLSGQRPDGQIHRVPAVIALPRGSYRLDFSRQNHHPRSLEVSIDPDSETFRQITLSAISGWQSPPLDHSVQPPLVGDLDGDATRDFVVNTTVIARGHDVDSQVAAVSGSSHSVIWRRRLGFRLYSWAVLTDCDGDWQDDVVVLSLTRREGRPLFEIMGLSGRTGQTLWIVTTPAGRAVDPRRYSGGASWRVRTLPDVDGDGIQDVALLTERVTVVSGRSGSIIWQRGFKDSIQPLGFVVTSGVDYRAGLPILCRTPSRSLIEIRACGDGSLLESTSVPRALHVPAVLLPGAREGSSIIVSPSDDEHLYALFNQSARPILHVPGHWLMPLDRVRSDFDADGTMDLVVVVRAKGRSPKIHERLIALSGATWDVLWEWDPAADASLQFPAAIQSGCTVSDGDREGQDILAVTLLRRHSGGAAGSVVLLGGGGPRRTSRVLGRYVLDGYAVDAVSSGDLDGDGVSELVVPSVNLGRVLRRSLAPVHVIKGLETGRQSGETLWRVPAGGRVWSSPAVGDLEGDGEFEVVVGSEDGTIRVLNGRDGASIWSYDTGKWVWSSPALADLDGDGTLDIVCGSDDHHVHAVSGRTHLGLWKVRTGREVGSSPWVGDLEGDGSLEIVVGSWDGYVRVIEGATGHVLHTLGQGRSRETHGIYASPTAADFDGDGVRDVVAGGMDDRVVAWSGRTGDELWSFDTHSPIHSSPVTADFDGDRIPDVVIGTFAGHVHALSGSDGRGLWRATTNGPVNGTPRVTDLDGDGVPDVLIGSEDSFLWAFSGSDGHKLWRTCINGASQGAALVDLDADGVLDAVVGSGNHGRLYAISGKDGFIIWVSDRLDGELWSIPAVRDLNGDHRPEVVTGCYDGRIHAITLEPGRKAGLLTLRSRLEQGTHRSLIDMIERKGSTDPRVAMAAARARVALDDAQGALVDLKRAMESSFRSPGLGALHLICSLAARNRIDHDLVGCCLALDPAAFLEEIRKASIAWCKLDRDALRQALLNVREGLADKPHRGRSGLHLARDALDLLLGRTPHPVDPIVFLEDAVGLDYHLAIHAIHHRLRGDEERANIELQRLTTRPGRRFAALWPVNEDELAKLFPQPAER